MMWIQTLEEKPELAILSLVLLKQQMKLNPSCFQSMRMKIPGEKSELGILLLVWFK